MKAVNNAQAVDVTSGETCKANKPCGLRLLWWPSLVLRQVHADLPADTDYTRCMSVHVSSCSSHPCTQHNMHKGAEPIPDESSLAARICLEQVPVLRKATTGVPHGMRVLTQYHRAAWVLLCEGLDLR